MKREEKLVLMQTELKERIEVVKEEVRSNGKFILDGTEEGT